MRRTRARRGPTDYIDVCILQATYGILNPAKTEGMEYPEVRLYGKTKDGQSIVLTTTEFKPYFHCEDTPSARRFLQIRQEVIKFEPVVLDGAGGERPCLKVFTRVPANVSFLRSKLEQTMQVQCFSADILFGLRFMMDQGIGPFVRVRGKYDDYKDNHYGPEHFIMESIEPLSQPFDVPLTIMSFDMEVSPHDDHIHCISWCTNSGGDGEGGSERTIFDEQDDDRNVIGQFARDIRDIDPDIIVGHNIIGYDFDVLERRASLFNIPLRLGRDGGKLRVTRNGETVERVSIQGRVVVDTWILTKQEKYFASQGRKKKSVYEDLDTVAFELGWEGPKKQIDASMVDEIWLENRGLVLEYCLTDARKAAFIFDQYGAVDKAVMVAHRSRNPLERGFTPRQSWLWDTILIPEADRLGWVVPCNTYGKMDKDEEDKISGGYVVEPVPGLHDWVAGLDVSGMYPSQIITYNICFTTFTNRRTNVHTTPHLEKCDTHAHYLREDEREGIIPRILKELIAERKYAKRRYKETGDEYWERLQRAIKVLINAIYGLLASSFWRFTNREIGESITTYSSEHLKGLVGQIEAMGVEVVYGDTDSVYIKCPAKRVQDNQVWAETIATSLSTETLELGLERVFERFFNHGRKKRYAGKVVWPEEYVYVRGYEMRRGDSFEYQREVLENLLYTIVEGEPERACLETRERLRKLREGDVPPEQLVTIKGCRSDSEYAHPERMAQVRARDKLVAMGHQWVPGQKVAYIVTDSKVTPQEVEPYIDGHEISPDYAYYTERVLNSVAGHRNEKDDPAGIVQCFGWDRESMVTDNRPTTIEEWF